jgi:uncharacterized protein (UPF0216 family)
VLIDDDTLKRWMSLEVHETNQQAVTNRRRLRKLRREDEPTAQARNGSTHAFDPDALEAFADELSPLVRVNLQLPITVYFDHETTADAYVSHEWAIDALGQLDEVDTTPRDGKLWLSRTKAMQLSQKYPSVFQLMLA